MERIGADIVDVYVGRNRLDYIPGNFYIGGMEYLERDMRCIAVLDADGNLRFEENSILYSGYAMCRMDR